MIRYFCINFFQRLIKLALFITSQVLEYFESRESTENQPVHVINIDIQDNHEEATVGAFLIGDMMAMVISKKSLFAQQNNKKNYCNKKKRKYFAQEQQSSSSTLLRNYSLKDFNKIRQAR